MVPVWTLRGLAMYRVHFVIDLLTRKVEITHIGCQYSGELMLQIARNLTDAFEGFLTGKKYLLHDRDTLFTNAFRELLRSSGTIPFWLPVCMPMMNGGRYASPPGYAECFVKSIKRVPSLRSGDKAKRPCLDKMIFFSEDALLARACD